MASRFICEAVAPALECIVCSLAFKPRNKSVRCCSSQCKVVQSHRTRSANARIRNARKCERCGVDFQRRNPSGKARCAETNEGRFCSRACAADAARVHTSKAEGKLAYKNRQRALRGIPPIPSPALAANCAECNTRFSQRSFRTKVCSDQCRHALAKRVSIASWRDRPRVIPGPRPCRNCKRSFVPVHGDRHRVFCSRLCLRAASRRSIGKNHRKRARRYGVEYEPVNALAVLKRDGWRCQICGIRTPQRLRGSTAPNAPELDHRIPMAMGGGHTRDNTQCACRRCNIAKGGRRIEGQLPLFGG